MKKKTALLFGIAFAVAALIEPTLPSANAALVNEVEIWTTYNSYNVMQEPESMTATSQKGAGATKLTSNKTDDLSINVTMGKGETEAAQVIVTPKNAVGAYSLELSDLTCGDAVLAKENIKVYKQCYIYPEPNPKATHYHHIPQGYYPDMLLPMEKAVEYGENKIEAEKNQGLTIEVRTSANQTPGVYTGAFGLTVDGVKTEIPVTVSVRDVDLSKTYYRTVGASTADLPEEVYEMLLNDYRISGQFLPASLSSPEKMLEQLEKYWDNPNFSNFELPQSADAFYKFVYALALNSTEERNYLTRASVYLQDIDESNDMNKIVNRAAPFRVAKDKVIAQLAAMFPDDAERQAAVKEAIDGIPVYTATTFEGAHKIEDFRYDECDLSFALASANGGRYNEIMEDFVAAGVDGIYIYSNRSFTNNRIGMSLPHYPAGMRSIAWAGAKYDFTGFLFWDMDAERTHDGSQKGTNEYYRSRNYYEDPVIFSINGEENDLDGLVIYPAKKYGDAVNWYGSLRLAHFRDGIEDHTLITELEKLYNEGLFDKYGFDGDFDDTIAWVYDQYLSTSSTFYVDDGRTVETLRSILFDLIDLAKSDVKFVSKGIAYNGKTARVSFFAEADEVKVNGATALKNGCLYTAEVDFNESKDLTIDFTKGGETQTFTAQIFAFGTAKQIDLTALNDENIDTYAQTEVGSVKAENGKLVYQLTADETEDPLYFPRFSLQAALFGTEDVHDIYYVSMKVRVKYNADVKTLPFTVYVSEGTWSHLGLTNFVLRDIDGDGWMEETLVFKVDRMNTVQRLRSLTFELKGYHYDSYKAGATIEISDIWYTKWLEGLQ